MIHITSKFKCKDIDGSEHIVLTVSYWDTGLNKYVRKNMIEMPGHDIKNKNGVKTGFYPTTYMTAGQLDIELDLETRVDI